MWPSIPWLNRRRSTDSSRPLSRHLSSLKDLNSILNNPSTSQSQTLNSPSQTLNPQSQTLNYPDSPVVHRTFSLRSSRRDSFHLSESASKEPKKVKVIIYTTSIRAIRSTAEDCRSVLSILTSLRVSFDLRDVSMHAPFLSELKLLLLSNPNFSLPQVFVGERWIGGAEEVKRLHESGELKRVLEGVERGKGELCGSCGGVRFRVCGTCNGGHKLFSEKRGKFRVCGVCNENGLVRCGECAL